MGLIKAALSAAGSVLADQWKEYFYCDSLREDVLMVKGQKRVGSRSSNTKGSENIISNGSVIAVADGQCMMIVDQGKIAEVCAEPGEFIFDSSAEPSIFAGKFGESLKASFATFGRRFTFGGDEGRIQRVYYFNTKELIGNKYGTPSPVPFRVVDANIGLDTDISIRCFGEYSYRICDPILFYTNVCANVSGIYTRDKLDGQLKSELLTALGPAFARISEKGIRYSALPGHTMEIAEALNQVLSAKWRELRGLEIVNFGVSSVKASEEDEKRIKDLQATAVFRSASMGAAHLTYSQGEAMKTAAGNKAGAMVGFAGMNIAGHSGGVNAGQLYQMAQNEPKPAAPEAAGWKCSCGATATGNFCTVCGSRKPEPKAQDGWRCPGCGTVSAGNFCMVCGTKKPEDGWKCACGSVNKGKFCPECGAKKPAGIPQYKCDKCGWEPEKGATPPRFCPECGDRFDNDDIV